MNRGPIVLVWLSLSSVAGSPLIRRTQTIDEAEYLLDQMPPPSVNDDELVKKLRQRLRDLLAELRAGAEGNTQVKQS
ncbi:hypothetical protein R3P38DRAFT_3175655 [Favolaschia claudopus]|uniref:Uncharacterized protein n=1 Tax=Favolaschia claudopus TaxID=2862362 RepID=A0AAW0D1P2_9AGAR